jgi:hypothetical protein
MAKKVWISFPLITTSDLKEESVVTFLKGGQKKELEVEVAAFVTKWLMDRDVPFGIDFDSCGVDRAIVIESLPKRLQKILGATTAPAIAETADVPQVVAETTQIAEAGAAEQVPAVEEAMPGEDARAVEEVAEAEELAAEPHAEDRGIDGSSELR